jgi:N-acetylglucosamine malate deacetylase 1
MLRPPDQEQDVMPLDKEQQEWLAFVEGFGRAYGFGLQLTARRPYPEPPLFQGWEGIRPLVLICAPHPDDEMLTGSLALRLHRQGASVLVLALTLGSDPARKAARRDELAAACRAAGFAWRLVTEPLAFPVLRPGLEQQTARWQEMRDELERHFASDMPALVIAPHALDGHPAHRAAHRLVAQALERHSRLRQCQVLLAETEYWQPMTGANLLLGVKPEELAVLLAALAYHRGEMERHLLHLRQPARMMDNVRRGAGMLGGSEDKPCDFLFGEIYRLSWLDRGRLVPLPHSKILLPGERVELSDLTTLFQNRAAS